MTKKEVVKKLRSLLTEAIRDLPDDVEYKDVSLFLDKTYEHDIYDDIEFPLKHGELHVIELTVEEERIDDD